jgi:hypothetical protein
MGRSKPALAPTLYGAAGRPQDAGCFANSFAFTSQENNLGAGDKPPGADARAHNSRKFLTVSFAEVDRSM